LSFRLQSTSHTRPEDFHFFRQLLFPVLVRPVIFESNAPAAGQGTPPFFVQIIE
jgi:hypothetical protein